MLVPNLGRLRSTVHNRRPTVEHRIADRLRPQNAVSQFVRYKVHYRIDCAGIYLSLLPGIPMSSGVFPGASQDPPESPEQNSENFIYQNKCSKNIVTKLFSYDIILV